MGDGAAGRSGVIYRVDPRVFRDGDNDGVGDLTGLIAQLDYVRLLGVDALWLTSSPPPRLGVVSLAPQVDLFGAAGSPTLFGLLIREARRRGLLVLLDIAPLPGRAAGRQVLPSEGHRARDGGRGRIATLPAASVSTSRWWLDLGADAVWTGETWQMARASGRSASALLAGLAGPSVLFAADHHSVACPTCAVCADPDHCAAAPSPAGSGGWVPRRLVAAIAAARPVEPEVSPLWVLADAGAARPSGCLATGLARLAATLLLTLPGVAVVTGGDEVGVVDATPGPEVGRLGGVPRPPERAPMPWDEGANGGFTAAPWRPLVGGGTAPVSAQLGDPDSLLSYHRRLIALRRREPALGCGAVGLVLAEGGVLAYLVERPGSRLLVVLNGGATPTEVPLRGPLSGHVALATDRQREGLRISATLGLAPSEGVVIRLTV